MSLAEQSTQQRKHCTSALGRRAAAGSTHRRAMLCLQDTANGITLHIWDCCWCLITSMCMRHPEPKRFCGTGKSLLLVHISMGQAIICEWWDERCLKVERKAVSDMILNSSKVINFFLLKMHKTVPKLVVSRLVSEHQDIKTEIHNLHLG